MVLRHVEAHINQR